MKVSIIIPIHCFQEHIEPALASAVQSCSGEMELVLVDDGCSGEDFAKIQVLADNFGAVTETIIVRHKRNLGLAAARNSGVRVASGAYVRFLDSDDLLLQGSTDMLVREALRSGAYVVYGAVRRLDSLTGTYKQWSILKIHNPQNNNGRIQLSRLAFLWDAPRSTPIHSALFKKTSSLKFDESLRFKEDYAFWLSLAGQPVAYLEKEVAVYRMSPHQMSKNIWGMFVHELRVAQRVAKVAGWIPGLHRVALSIEIGRAHV